MKSPAPTGSTGRRTTPADDDIASIERVTTPTEEQSNEDLKWDHFDGISVGSRSDIIVNNSLEMENLTLEATEENIQLTMTRKDLEIGESFEGNLAVADVHHFVKELPEITQVLDRSRTSSPRPDSEETPTATSPIQESPKKQQHNIEFEPQMEVKNSRLWQSVEVEKNRSLPTSDNPEYSSLPTYQLKIDRPKSKDPPSSQEQLENLKRSSENDGKSNVCLTSDRSTAENSTLNQSVGSGGSNSQHSGSRVSWATSHSSRQGRLQGQFYGTRSLLSSNQEEGETICPFPTNLRFGTVPECVADDEDID